MRLSDVSRLGLRPVARRRPIRTWPAAWGRYYGIATPAGVQPLPEASPRGSANVRIVLTLLARTHGVPGDVAECGVFRGGTLVPMTLDTVQAGLDKTVFGFDSFEGFDESVRVDIELGGQPDHTRQVGGFSNTSEDLVRRKLSWLGLESKSVLHKGYFETTLAQAADRSFSFVHLDCDLYESYRTCLEFFYPRLRPQGIVLFDEYEDPSWPGCTRAVDEFMASVPEQIETIELDNYRRAFFVKQ